MRKGGGGGLSCHRCIIKYPKIINDHVSESAENHSQLLLPAVWVIGLVIIPNRNLNISLQINVESIDNSDDNNADDDDFDNFYDFDNSVDEWNT